MRRKNVVPAFPEFSGAAPFSEIGGVKCFDPPN
jgi:hypothetical protein